ncbi:MAG: C1 family peptidase [Flavobacteriales bacterium]|nr:MAG: C1 family peptidase [Flavobacteriales bacterium]
MRHCSLLVLLLTNLPGAHSQSGLKPASVPLPLAGFVETAGVEHDFVLPSDCPLPRRVDMSPFFPVAGDQKHQASCTAWALGYGLASFRRNWESNIKPDKSVPPNEADIYSPGFLFNMVKQYVQPDTSARACLNGVDLCSTFAVACQYGNCTWAEYPYDAQNGGCKDTVPMHLLMRARERRLPRPVMMWRSDPGGSRFQAPFDAVQWKYHLARKEPVVVNIDIDCSFLFGGDSAWRNQEPFIWNVLKANDRDTCYGGHVMVCTGYDDHDSTFTFLNSFGHRWGENGYVRIPFSTLRTITRVSYIFSQQWWQVIPVPEGKDAQDMPVVDSTLSGLIKPGLTHRFHDLEVRVVTISPDKRNIVIQFSDSSKTVPVFTMEFPSGVKRSFIYEDKLWSLTYNEPGTIRRMLGKAVPFTIKVDHHADDVLETQVENHLARWRRSNGQK